MTNTPNFNLSIAEGTDTVNLLTQCYPNFETIDTVMKENKDAAITTATETKTGTNHSIVRANADAEVFRFTATSDYVAGDTFTVDAQAVTVTTPDGQSLQSGAFVINKSVICCLVGTVLTVFVGGGSSDAQTLGGQLPSYYAKQSDMDIVENDVDTLNSNLTALEGRVDALENGEIYSTTEQEIGTWTDGKTIYRKCFNFTSSIRNTETVIALTDVANIVSIDGVAHRNDGWEIPINSYETPNAFVYVAFNKTTNKLYAGFPANINTLDVVFTYTKV